MPAKKNNRRSSTPKSQRVTRRSQRAKARLDQEAIDDQKFQQKLETEQFTAGIEREANEQLQCPGCGSSTWRMKPRYYVSCSGAQDCDLGGRERDA